MNIFRTTRVLVASVAFAALVLAGEAAAPARDARAKELESTAAGLRRRLADSRGEQKARLGLELGQTLRLLWHEHRSLSRERKGEGAAEPAPLERHARRAKAAFAEAQKVLATVHGEQSKSAPAAEALYYVGVLHEEAGSHEACARACEALLERYPDARIPAVVGDRMQFNVYLRLGDAHARLGHRGKAVDAFIRAILAAETDRYWQSGMQRLLDAEPRAATAAYRARLPQDIRQALEKAKERAGLLVELAPPKLRLPGPRPFAVRYRVTRRAEQPLEGYCLAFRLLPAEPQPLHEADLGEGVRDSGDAGHTGPLDLREGVIEGEFEIRRVRRPGQFIVVCSVTDFTRYTPQAVAPRPLPVLCWCEPIELKVAGD